MNISYESTVWISLLHRRPHGFDFNKHGWHKHLTYPNLLFFYGTCGGLWLDFLAISTTSGLRLQQAWVAQAFNIPSLLLSTVQCYWLLVSLFPLSSASTSLLQHARVGAAFNIPKPLLRFNRRAVQSIDS